MRTGLLSLALGTFACAGVYAENHVLFEDDFVSEAESSWPDEWTVFGGDESGWFFEEWPAGEHALRYWGSTHRDGGSNFPKVAWVNEDSLAWTDYQVSMRFSTDMWNSTTTTRQVIFGRVQENGDSYQIRMQGLSLRIMNNGSELAQSSPDIFYDRDLEEIWTLRATFMGQRILAEVFNVDGELVTSVITEDDSYSSGAVGIGGAISHELAVYNLLVEAIQPDIPVSSDTITVRQAGELEVPTTEGGWYRIEVSPDLEDWSGLEALQGDGESHFRLFSLAEQDREFFRSWLTEIVD